MRSLLTLLLWLFTTALHADPITVAFWNGELSAKGPGLMIKAITAGEHDELLDKIRTINADFLVLVDIDQDDQNWGLRLLAEKLELPHYFAAPTLRGVYSGFDLDQNNRREAQDAIGFGTFRGQHGIGIISRHPINAHKIITDPIWSQQPNTTNPGGYYTAEAWASLPLLSSGIWDVETNGFRLITTYATSPGFDGREDRNGHRNAAEIRYLSNHVIKQSAPFIIAASLNLDPEASNIHATAIQGLLAQPHIQNIAPIGPWGTATADWRELDLGTRRVDYILPSCHFDVLNSGQTELEMGSHTLLWVRLNAPKQYCR